MAPATINMTVGAPGATYGSAVHRDELEVSSTLRVKVRNGRERFATPKAATRLTGRRVSQGARRRCRAERLEQLSLAAVTADAVQ